MNRGIIAAAVIGVIAIGAIFGSWYTVDQTERAVLLRNGAVIGTAQPGLGFKVPFIDSVEKISVKTSTYTWDKMNSYSYDQQPADLKISVTLRASPDKVADLYAKFGRLDTAVNQVVNPVAAMVERSGLQPRTFSRRFRAATGYLPMHYVHALRIEEAKQAIETDDSGIDEIGVQVGYEDATFFRRLFKRQVGITPAAYRRKVASVYATR